MEGADILHKGFHQVQYLLQTGTLSLNKKLLIPFKTLFYILGDGNIFHLYVLAMVVSKNGSC